MHVTMINSLARLLLSKMHCHVLKSERMNGQPTRNNAGLDTEIVGAATI